MRAKLDASNPVLILVNARGDHLLNLPAIRAAAALFDGRLTVAVRRGAPDTFFRDLAVRRFLEIDLDFSSLSRRFDADELARRVGQCDLLLSLNPWHDVPTRRLLELLRPDWSVGYHPDFDEAIDLDFSRHNADLGFDLVNRLDPDLCIEDFAAPPALDPRAAAWVDELLCRLPEGHRLIVLHGETKADKMWPCERFVQVLEHVLERTPESWVIDIAHDRAPHDAGSLGNRVIPAAGLPMNHALAVVARARFFLGVDSCFLHAADLFRAPGVALFGPTDPHEFGFRFARRRHVKGPTMHDIEVEPVIRAVDELLGELNGD
jgi:ADP-heptose:LPS heptosyltransferase